MPSTLGYVAFLDHSLPESNASIVDILLDLGAVLYVKTNIPQTMMVSTSFPAVVDSYVLRLNPIQVADSHNNIFGRTLNPLRTNLTAGGSTGGEGALIALRGSLIGSGTDLAGSIRVPALCCGIYGFRPTSGRVPYGGIVSHSLPGYPGILGTAGPLTTCLDDTELYLNSLISAKPWKYDSTAHAVPWQQTVDDETTATSSPLRIGVLAEDPRWPFHPPVRRAIRDAANLLEKEGHTVIQLVHETATSAGTGLDLSLEYFSLDDTNPALRLLDEAGEPAINSLKVLGVDRPSPSRRKYSIQDLAALNSRRAEFGKAWHRQFTQLELDIVISPGAQNTAVPHDTYGLFPYTVIWNILDVSASLPTAVRIHTSDVFSNHWQYPASIIPFSQVSKIADPIPVTFEAPARGPPCMCSLKYVGTYSPSITNNSYYRRSRST